MYRTANFRLGTGPTVAGRVLRPARLFGSPTSERDSWTGHGGHAQSLNRDSPFEGVRTKFSQCGPLRETVSQVLPLGEAKSGKGSGLPRLLAGVEFMLCLKATGFHALDNLRG